MLEQWSWLKEVFGDSDEYLRALSAYYAALNINEYSVALGEGQETEFEPRKLELDIPTHFGAMSAAIERGAYRLLTANPSAVCEIWRSIGVEDQKSRAHCSAWLVLCQSWHAQLDRFGRVMAVLAVCSATKDEQAVVRKCARRATPVKQLSQFGWWAQWVDATSSTLDETRWCVWQDPDRQG